MSPTTTPRRSPKRAPSRRFPLQERTPSQKNEAASRLHRESRQELSDANIFSTTPFPTKPEHILRPSTIKKQKSRHNIENELPDFFAHKRETGASRSNLNLSMKELEGQSRRAPNLQLKQSVTALRDMYEAQAEKSRPSTAAPSPALRPSTAGSRMRSISSSESLSGRGAFQLLGLPKISPDDLATLPTLSEATARQLDSQASFAWRAQHQPLSSSPNFRTYGTISSQMPAYDDTVISSDPVDDMSSSALQQIGASSPNVIQLGFDTSMMTELTPAFNDDSELISSPNVVKLGTTSPRRPISPALSDSSMSSRKRKRSDIEGAAHAGHTPIFPGRSRRVQPNSPTRNPRATSERSLPSSETRVLPSSPPGDGDLHSRSLPASSPAIQVFDGRTSSESTSIGSAHANLQSVLSSSPGPIIQYPIVRAPSVQQFDGLTLQKQRRSQGPFLSRADASSKLSPVPSEAEMRNHSLTSRVVVDVTRSSLKESVFTEDLDDRLDFPYVAPTSTYNLQHDLNSSQLQMISDADRHEAIDELSALPRSRGGFLPSSMVPTQSFSHFSHFGNSLANESQSRLDSMRTSIHTRLESMRSIRPGSSDSQMSTLAVPTWARKYYSGIYRNSFQYLYQSTNNIPVTYLQPPARSSSIQRTQASSSQSHISKKSFQSVRSSIKNFIPSFTIPTTRPRMTVRNSHLSPGIGPLVSNPVRAQSLQYPTNVYVPSTSNMRQVSMPLSPADPRAHWNGIVEMPQSFSIVDHRKEHAHMMTPRRTGSFSSNAPPRSWRSPMHYFREPSPHLHHDRHLETGSSISRGFGYPYNHSSSAQLNAFDSPSSTPTWFSVDLRDAQVICFMSGFLLPLTWFLGAVLPLPPRPASYYDIEKAEFDARNGDISFFTSRPSMSDWDAMDVVARLRLERHIRGLEELRWQNARWWRKMNRWMCCVGLVVIVIIIILAVIGTKGHWA